ncbi:hypothetical protein KAU11_05150, partial [Candidatus Babeliales bacterium]|nr:hypothetical protein [Candidatus Babeliales bacterium]
SIMRFLEISAQGDENAEGGIEAVQKFLSEKIELITGEFEQDVADLKEQRDIVQETLQLPEGEKRDHVVGMLLEDIGELEDSEKFKQQVLEDAKLSRQEYDRMVGDIKDAVQEGGIAELEALFEAMELDRAENCYSEDDDEGLQGCCPGQCNSCSLDEGCDKMTEALREMSEPYSIDETKKADESDAEEN